MKRKKKTKTHRKLMWKIEKSKHRRFRPLTNQSTPVVGRSPSPQMPTWAVHFKIYQEWKGIFYFKQPINLPFFPTFCTSRILKTKNTRICLVVGPNNAEAPWGHKNCKFWVWSGATRCKSCRSRHMLQNEYLHVFTIYSQNILIFSCKDWCRYSRERAL